METLKRFFAFRNPSESVTWQRTKKKKRETFLNIANKKLANAKGKSGGKQVLERINEMVL